MVHPGNEGNKQPDVMQDEEIQVSASMLSFRDLFAGQT